MEPRCTKREGKEGGKAVKVGRGRGIFHFKGERVATVRWITGQEWSGVRRISTQVKYLF